MVVFSGLGGKVSVTEKNDPQGQDVSLMVGSVHLQIRRKVVLETLFLFIYFCCAGSSCFVRVFSSVFKQGLLFAAVCRLLIAVTSPVLTCGALFGAQALGAGASRASARGSVVVARELSCCLACGFFPDQDQTYVPCTGRWIFNHWTSIKPLEISYTNFMNVNFRQLIEISVSLIGRCDSSMCQLG